MLRALIGTKGGLEVIGYLAYPVGFIAVILGRAQLFTENTLFPVVLVLDERHHRMRMLRLWAVVFSANVFGSWLLALLAAKTPVLQSDVLTHLVDLGMAGSNGSPSHIFWSGRLADGSLGW